MVLATVAAVALAWVVSSAEVALALAVSGAVVEELAWEVSAEVSVLVEEEAVSVVADSVVLVAVVVAFLPAEAGKWIESR